MKFCRFMFDDVPHFGLVESIAGREMITRVFKSGPEDAVPDEDAPSKKIAAVGLEEVRLLAPTRPSKLLCVGRNYREHAKELGHAIPTEVGTFLKPPSAVIGPGENIRRPALTQQLEHEGELGVIIGQSCRKLGADEDVRDYILGYTCVNDVTARDLQKKDMQWTRAKGFDTFCPVGPVVTDEIDPWAGVVVETRVNGELRQHGTTTDFLFPLDAIIRHIAEVMTLLPGDLIATGTPPGVGPLAAGDVVEVSVEGVGTLRNPVVDD